jgi:hypothetical protein
MKRTSKSMDVQSISATICIICNSEHILHVIYLKNMLNGDWKNLYLTLKLNGFLVLRGKNIFYSDKYGTLYQYFKSLHTLITDKKASIHG